MTGFQRTGVLWRVTVCGLLLASACGGGSAVPDSGGTGTGGTTGAGGATATGTPVQMCNQLVTLLCKRDVSCNGGDASAGAQTDCETATNVLFGCDRATSTNFNDCMNDAKNLSCTGLFTSNGLSTPASCDAPLNIPLSDAQMKCVALVRALCTRGLQCDTPGTTPVAQDILDCESSIFVDPAGIPCPYATGVSATYAQCVTDLQAAPCPAVDGGTDAGGSGPIPSCQAVIKTP
jgi:hypothetical protein